MLIRCSKHNITKDTNQTKLVLLDMLFLDYQKDLQIYIDKILNKELPLAKRLSSKELPNETLKHSKYKRDIYIKASEIIRSQIEQAKKRRFNRYKKLYSYMKEHHSESSFAKKKFSELKLNDVLITKFFKKPKINNISINLTNEFFDIQEGNHFDSFVKIILPYFNEKGTRAIQINVPLKQHRHSNDLLQKGYCLRNNIQLKKINGSYFITLIWFKDDVGKKTNGTSLGMDAGYNKLIATSNGEYHNGNLSLIYSLIAKKQQGSNAFKKALLYRDNEINRIINNIDLTNIKQLYIEDLKNVKFRKKYNDNKIQRWSYRKAFDKIIKISEEQGISLVKVSPAYTSQTCSRCGHIDEKSRQRENYQCVSCGYEADADLNAAVNILNRGTYSSSNNKNDFIDFLLNS